MIMSFPLFVLAMLLAGASIQAQPNYGGQRKTVQPNNVQQQRQLQRPQQAQNQRYRPDNSGIGGAVYATGLGEVTVTMYADTEFPSDHAHSTTTEVNFTGIKAHDGSTTPAPATATAAAPAAAGGYNRPATPPATATAAPGHSTGSGIPLGTNKKHSAIRLGKLVRGEIMLHSNVAFADNKSQGQSQSTSQNNDQPRTRVHDLSPGVIEVYFENQVQDTNKKDGTPTGEPRWVKEVKLVFSGAVTSDPGVIGLLEKINDPDANTRNAAREALKTASPMIARMAGVH